MPLFLIAWTAQKRQILPFLLFQLLICSHSSTSSLQSGNDDSDKTLQQTLHNFYRLAFHSIYTDAIKHLPLPCPFAVGLIKDDELTSLLNTLNSQFQKMAAPLIACDSALFKNRVSGFSCLDKKYTCVTLNAFSPGPLLKRKFSPMGRLRWISVYIQTLHWDKNCRSHTVMADVNTVFDFFAFFLRLMCWVWAWQHKLWQ